MMHKGNEKSKKTTLKKNIVNIHRVNRQVQQFFVPFPTTETNKKERFHYFLKLKPSLSHPHWSAIKSFKEEELSLDDKTELPPDNEKLP